MRHLKIEIDIPGLIRAIDDGTSAGLILGSNLVAADAKGRAPQRTGQLVASIRALPPEGKLSEGGITAIVSAGAPYALFVEFGTGLYGPRHQRIRPKRAKAMRWLGPGGDYIFARSTAGMQPRPYLIPALENNAEEVAEVIADAIGDAVEERNHK